jgi:hypothetical protein
MKKIKVCLWCSSIAMALAALAFLNNVVAVVNWWRAFLRSGGVGDVLADSAHGFIPWLEWTVVDYSAVTTFIPFLALLMMTVSFVRVIRGDRLKVGDFPFFAGSDQFNIALGLFGTLWGIIVIGYYKLDTVSMADLMQCLHTALFSTLMAVVWVFLVDRPILRPYFTRILIENDLALSDDSDLGDAVDRLVIRLSDASDKFDKRQKGFEEAFEKRQKAYEADFEKRQKLFEDAFKKRLEEFENVALRRFASQEAEFIKQMGSFEDAFKRRSEKENEIFRARLEKFEEAFKKRSQEETEELKTRQKVFSDELKKELVEQGEAFRLRQKEYDEDFERRQREYVELFERRIGELEAMARSERERRENADAKLKSVAAALGAGS